MSATVFGSEEGTVTISELTWGGIALNEHPTGLGNRRSDAIPARGGGRWGGGGEQDTLVITASFQ